MQREPCCWPMKSQSLARLRSMGLGLHAELSRVRLAVALLFPARTWIALASQLATSAFPAAVSRRLTIRLPRRA